MAHQFSMVKAVRNSFIIHNENTIQVDCGRNCLVSVILTSFYADHRFYSFNSFQFGVPWSSVL